MKGYLTSEDRLGFAYRGENVEDIYHERNRYRKQARKLREQINRYRKHTPGASRVWNIDRLAIEMEAEADRLRAEGVPHSDPEGLEADALYLRRLGYDLITLYEVVKGAPRGRNPVGKYDDSQWPRGPRP